MNFTKFAAGGVLLLAAASCGPGGHNSAADTDSAFIDSATAREEAILDSAASLTLTADSIGCIRIGMAVDRIPGTVAGFYASTTLDSTPDAQTISFNDPQGDPLFTAYDFMEGKVDVIALNGTRYGVATPGGELRIGDEFPKVLALPGVRSEWQGLDDNGVWWWTWQGLWLGPDEAGMSESLSEKMCDPRRPPMASDFSGVKTGYIGTGTPY